MPNKNPSDHGGICFTMARRFLFSASRFATAFDQQTLFTVMKVLSSLASAKRRHADCQVVKRKGTVYVICKSNPKFKARQGATPGTRLSKKGL